MENEVENPGPGLGQVQKCGKVKLPNGIQFSPSWYLNLHQQKVKKKNLHRFASTQNNHILSKINDNTIQWIIQ